MQSEDVSLLVLLNEELEQSIQWTFFIVVFVELVCVISTEL